MLKQSSFLFFMLIFLFMGCASTSSLKRNEPITILLKNGDKIEAEVLDIWHNKLVFKALDWKKAYEYGEVLNFERIEGIQIADGSILSVKDYKAYRKGSKLKAKKKDSAKKETLVETKEVDEKGDFQYEELKKKPIAEMTDNEFKYFIMMKEKELNAQKEAALTEKQTTSTESQKEEIVDKKEEKITQTPTEEIPTYSPEIQTEGLGLKLPRSTFPPLTSHNNLQIEEVVESLIEAGLAPSYIKYLNNKSDSGKLLTPTETTILRIIEKNPKWQEKLEDLKFLTRAAQKALSRSYLYTPEDLSEKLGLQFDPDLDMDFFDLMEQLHRKLGGDVRMSDFRNLVDVLGESGARAVKEILENYASWKFILNKDNSLVKK